MEVLILIGFILAWIFGATFWKYINQPGFSFSFSEKQLEPGRVAILESYFPYYLGLKPEQQREFQIRVSKFIADKEFIPRGMPSVTEEMKVLIAATAVQITFGFIPLTFKYFRYIVIYPDSFYSVKGQNYHKGEVNPGDQAIALSWKSFAQTMGLRDGKNLGLHEMAHALRIENVIKNKEFGFLNRYQLAKWEVFALREIKRIRNEGESIFRRYAATNEEEFFAVSVEVFFEIPEKFLEYHPELYALMAKLLNQNPMKSYA